MPPPKGGGNLKYIIVGLLFVGGAAAVFVALRPLPPDPVAAVPDAEPPARATSLATDELEIPDPVPDAAVEPDAASTNVKRIIKYVRDDWECDGSIAAAAARAVIAQNQVQVRNCYERALKINNTLEGNLSMTLRVDNRGQVTGTRMGGSLRDPQIFSCVRQLAQSWEFPAPTGGRCAVISAPFNFTPRR
jgi:hypothetical protein